MELQTPVQYIKGIGPRRAEDLSSRNIFTVEDLLYYLPYRYEDRSHFKQVKELQPGDRTSILVEVLTSGLVITRKTRFRIFDLAARDASGVVRCKWFHSEYLDRKKIFRPGQKVIFYGKFEVDPYGTGNLQIINPEFEVLDEESLARGSLEMGRIVPVYEAVKGCSSRVLRRILHNVLKEFPGLPETLPEELVLRLKLPDLGSALQQAHFPPASVTMDELAGARSPALVRLIFEELFFLEVGMALKRRTLRSSPGIPFQTSARVREALKKILPFHPTAAQKRALKEIVDDLCRPAPMNRLLQGDVGSGKTIVALEAAAVAIENGCQAGLLAPTEILAEQHFFYTQRIYAASGYQVGLLTSSLKKADRQALLDRLADGSIHLLIGTHAVLEADVEFQKLGLVVIDEQHRFGVMQRLNMMKKGTWPHTLVMTATPIPRTLAMTLYGDLDVSVIDELPPHRVPITTRKVPEIDRASAYQLIREQVQQGRQIYIVCPLVEESEKTDLRAAQETYEHLSQKIFSGLRVGLLHGRQKSGEKEEVMARFAANETHILVATTVIEVGVDVPNASVMMVEHAERFGLAQLHQLRGRIGRGTSRSICLLMHGQRLTDEAEARLQCMVETTNGFKIAEKDLEIRGPGEFFGTKQAGLPALRAANLIRDRELLELARTEALIYVENPPSEENFQRLLEHLKSNWQRRYGLAAVG